MTDASEFPIWLKQTRPALTRLAGAAKSLIENMIVEAGIDHLAVTARVKSMDSAIEKAQRKSYSDPKTQMTDLVGVRVVTFLPRQTEDIAKLITGAFAIDQANSQDRAATLGSDKVGYRSIHYVCSLGGQRARLTEYKGISDLKFEVQIRTVLQHAWAELAHDNSFKFNFVLPTDIQRKLNLHSAMLEIVDMAFQEISDDVAAYSKMIETSNFPDLPDEEINSINIIKAAEEIAKKIGIEIRGINLSTYENIIEELKHFGITRTKEIEYLFREEFSEYYKKIGFDTIYGLFRTAMMLNDIHKYFSGPADWQLGDRPTYDILKRRYGKKVVDAVFEENNIEIDG